MLVQPAEEFSTLVHEIAHEMLHRGDGRTLTTKKVRETEAEAVAFVVCQSVGLQNGTSSQDYIQLWHGDANSSARELGSSSTNRCRDPRGHCARASGTRGSRMTRQALAPFGF
jgi:hypothetical protein